MNNVLELPVLDSLDAAGIIIPSVPCDIIVSKGSAVYLDSTGTAKLAIATSMSTSNVFGIVENKPASNLCDVRVLGVSSELYGYLDMTQEYYLSDATPGMITTSPISSGHVVIKLGQPFSATRFLFNKGIPIIRA